MSHETVKLPLEEYLKIKAVFDNPRSNDAVDKVKIADLEKRLEWVKSHNIALAKSEESLVEANKLKIENQVLHYESRITDLKNRFNTEIDRLKSEYKEVETRHNDLCKDNISLSVLRDSLRSQLEVTEKKLSDSKECLNMFITAYNKLINRSVFNFIREKNNPSIYYDGINVFISERK